jgi:tetratricopeptide (TPR) repeat protein
VGGLSFVKASENYVGAEACAGCHKIQTEAWLSSDHYQSMQPARQPFVLGNFSDITFSKGKRTTRFFTKDGEYFIETPNSEGKQQIFLVRYVFGYRPLQQYLLETEPGRLQAFDVAWDTRPQPEGGQRWYQLQDESVTDPEHPFFWTGYYQNWNSRCAACHTTDFEKQFNNETNQYRSTWTDVNVACESCHGPGKEHIKSINNRAYSPANTSLRELGEKLVFHFSDGDPIARPKQIHQGPSLALDTCGACHSRRAELKEPIDTEPYHQQFQLEGLEEPLYFSDGQIRDEVFVLGSFLQSKMAGAGVTCTNCHDPHSGKTLLPGAQICSTCHATTVYAQPNHTNNHEGADCLDCHMPQRTYMGVDTRRDHRFHRPTTKHPNSSYPCKACHMDAAEEWLNDALSTWPKRQGAAPDTLGTWAAINRRLTAMDATAINTAQKLLDDSNLPSLEKSALIEKMVTIAPQSMIERVFELANDADPIARQSAARAAASLPEEPGYRLVLKLSQDPVKSVRSIVASTILSMSPDWFTRAPQLMTLLEEYKSILFSGQDHPGANLGLATIALYEQNVPAAIKAYELALTIDPKHIPSLLSYANFLRSFGNEDKARAQLALALHYGDDIAAVQFSYGLQKIRDKAYQEAIPYLEKATTSPDASPRYAFVYAVALWQLNYQQQAIDVLVNATTRWPGNYEVLVTWAKYAYHLQDAQSMQKAVDELGKYYANDATYLQLKNLLQ